MTFSHVFSVCPSLWLIICLSECLFVCLFCVRMCQFLRYYGKCPLVYLVTQKSPQIYTVNHATFPIQIRKITVQICGNFCVTQYSLSSATKYLSAYLEIFITMEGFSGLRRSFSNYPKIVIIYKKMLMTMKRNISQWLSNEELWYSNIFRG